jgi:uncharacterized SAM-binding protein YcdF (DUF218 family)
MFFVLSKVLAFLAVPSNIILGIGVLGMLPIGRGLIALLEDRFPPGKEAGPSITGFIVLGGPIDSRMSVLRGMISVGGDVERLIEGAALAQRHPAARLVFTGGNPSLLHDDPPESFFAAQLFEQLGVPASRLTLEDKSRNTEENAVFTKRLVDPKPGERWLLVTSAMHMPRSVGVFRKAGFPVEPYPVAWQTLPGANLLSVPRDLLNGLGSLDAVSHELVGLVVYWLTGRSSELFPGPLPDSKDCCAKPG